MFCTCLLCGGYVGCLNCLLYTMGNRNKSKLIHACRGRDATPNYKGRSDVSNLAKGKFPPNTLQTWPSGELRPVPWTYNLSDRAGPELEASWKPSSSTNCGVDPGDSDFITRSAVDQLNNIHNTRPSPPDTLMPI